MSMLQKASIRNVSEKSALVDRLRRPEYTGDNRCIPCTVVNLVLGTALSIAVVGVLVSAGASLWVGLPVGGALFLVSLGAIYLRGYLVPYTPQLTKRYLPDRVLRWFDKASTTQPIGEVEDLDVERFLLEGNLLTECATVDDWCLEDSFKERWYAAMEDFEDENARAAAIADLLHIDPDRLRVLEYGSATAVKVDGREVGQWESDAAFLADLAADAALAEGHADWTAMHPVNRSQILNSLRMFLEECPSCGAPLELGQQTVDSCCRTFEVVAVSCEACDARVFELETDRVAG